MTDDGEFGVYKKMSLCWLWGRERFKLSSDRLKRVQYKNGGSKITKKNKKAKQATVYTYKTKTKNIKKKKKQKY